MREIRNDIKMMASHGLNLDYLKTKFMIMGNFRVSDLMTL